MLEFFNTLINYDKKLLLFLHSQGNYFWDDFWIFITTPLNWIPLFLVLFFLGYKVFELKNALVIMVFTALSAATAFTVVNIIKNYIQRLRPINDTSINVNIRVLIEQNDFSFVSGHSTVSFTVAFLMYWILKREYSYAFLIFLFPLLFAYSRIYLAAHFPLDILFGMLLGYLIATVFNIIIQKIIFKKATT